MGRKSLSFYICKLGGVETMSKLTNRQKIDASHEARMWIKDVIIPAVTACVFIDRINPGLKYRISDWGKEKFAKVKSKF